MSKALRAANPHEFGLPSLPSTTSTWHHYYLCCYWYYNVFITLTTVAALSAPTLIPGFPGDTKQPELDAARVLTPLGRQQAERVGDRLASLLQPALRPEREATHSSRASPTVTL